jgi:hypothetical protein
MLKQVQHDEMGFGGPSTNENRPRTWGAEAIF